LQQAEVVLRGTEIATKLGIKGIVLCQAVIRGFLARKRYRERGVHCLLTIFSCIAH
jgi:hypothetical protein